MFLKSCLNCKYHEVAREGEEEESRCLKENCYARFSKCVAQKALDKFLDGESSRQERSFSSLTQMYPVE